MSFRKKIAAVVTSLALITSATSCGHASRWSVRYADQEASAGIFLYYQMNAYFEAVSKVTEENKELDTTDTNALKAAYIEGKDFVTWVNDEATEKVRMYFAVGKLFDEYELELTEEEESTIDLNVYYYWDYYGYGETYEAVGISKQSYRDVNELTAKSSAVFKYLYSIGGTEEYPVEDIKQYLEDSYMRIKYIELSEKDTSGNLFADEYIEQIEDEADEYLVRLKSGVSMDSLIAEAQEFYNGINEASTKAAADATTTTPTVPTEEADVDNSSDSDETSKVVDAITRTGSSEDDDERTSSASSSRDNSDDDSSTEDSKDDSSEADESSADEDLNTDTTLGTEESAEETAPYPNEHIILKGDPETESYSPSKVVNDAFVAAKKGEYALIKDDESKFIYIFCTYDILERTDLWEKEESRLVYLNEILGDKYNEKLLEVVTDSEITRNANAYKRYSPFDFK